MNQELKTSTVTSQTAGVEKLSFSRPSGRFPIAVYEGIIGIIYTYVGFSIVHSFFENNPTEEDIVAYSIVYAPIFLLIGLSALSCGLFLILMKEWARVGSMVVTSVSTILLFPLGIVPAILSIWYLYREETIMAFDKNYHKFTVNRDRTKARHTPLKQV